MAKRNKKILYFLSYCIAEKLFKKKNNQIQFQEINMLTARGQLQNLTSNANVIIANLGNKNVL